MKTGSKTRCAALASLFSVWLVAPAASADVPGCEAEAVAAPADGATDVPLNTRIWGGSPRGRIHLTGPDGEVEAEQRYFPLAGPAGSARALPVLVPSELLLPQTQYRVEDEARPALVRHFTTGGATDAEAPALPELLSVERTVGIRVELAFDGILVAAGDPLGTFESLEDLLKPEGFADGYFGFDESEPLFTLLTQRPTLELATRECADPLLERGLAVHFAAFDASGNFSGWSALVEVDPPEEVWRRPVVDPSWSTLLPTPSPAPAPTASSASCSAAIPTSSGFRILFSAMACALLGLGIARRRHV
jgi:hypothetical protein